MKKQSPVPALNFDKISEPGLQIPLTLTPVTNIVSVDKKGSVELKKQFTQTKVSEEIVAIDKNKEINELRKIVQENE